MRGIAVLLALLLMLPGCLSNVSESEDVFNGRDINYKPVPMFTLIDESGEEFNLSDYEGKVVVISFVFTRCPDVCPVVVQSLRWLTQQFPDEYPENLQILAVTVDPWSDTPNSMASWKQNMSADWKFLSWDIDTDNDGEYEPEELAVIEEVWGAFDVGLTTYEDVNGTSGRHHPLSYLVDHTTSTFILDRKLTQRVEWEDYDWVPELVADDVRLLLEE